MISEDAEDQLFKKHADLCNKLNLDSKSVTESWESFRTLNQKFSLEGDPLHWLGCAVFVACRKSITPTVGSSDIEGNCVSLTSLLRYCNLNLIQFFCNIRRWSDMNHLAEEFRKKIDALEESFSVTCNVFKEYCMIFPKIFKAPELSDMEIPKQHRNRKQKSVQCTPAKIFEFIWNLYITIRGEDSSYSNDLVQSYHLLLGICDLAFKNAFLTDRRDLLNPQFSGLPSDWMSPDFTCPDEVPSIIDKIITNSSNSLDAKYVEKYHCRSILSTFFKNEILCGNEQNFIGLFDPQVFESNFKAIKKAYETQLLSNGGFDERIFLAEYRRRILEKERETQNSLGTPPHSESGDELPADSPGQPHSFGTVSTRICDTPLTGRRFLSPRDGKEVSSVVSASHNIARLQVILSGRLSQPSDALRRIFQSSCVSPAAKIAEIVTRLGNKFINNFVQPKNSVNVEEQNEYARNKLLTGTKLFYKLIEGILEHEKTINKDISVLVQKDLFYECVFACSMEIVLHCYNSPPKFPWILTALDIDACDFVKIIELIVRSKDPFHRDTIKHLNKIEETILESLAWKSTSNLWNLIKQCEQGIPKEEEVALPSQVVTVKPQLDIKPPIVNEEPKTPKSPGPSATEHFQSPVQISVNRQLFPGTKSTSPKSSANSDCKNNSTEEISNEVVIPPAKPKRTGGLSIFFRKFYNLAAVRMKHLCTQLNINDNELKRKIWTVFEVSIQKKAESLLKDRHLDQLLMCAVYVIPKVLQKPQTFMEIMKCYRLQPQADSYIYRDVLLENKSTKVIDGLCKEIPERRGDLIEFYNSVYVFEMKDFTMKFANGTQPCNILVSPLPVPSGRRCLISPSVQIIKNVFVKPLDSPVIQNPTVRSYSYFFSRSPSKDLKDINKAINNNGLNVNGKRLLIDGDELPSTKKIATRKVQSLLEERRRQY
ncbi:retinoblastoma-like protein 1 isoform X2 [Coccinella septempunctata]|uniref:retinoblastoma-like protein 1 isoform X2 n=1 Tax=Coccinella septempunctata TaxID=41139 RepID=UPI001D0969C8|nr:retinoblastoma-like protein 1 isoform X2 [Coccinella septempunctata]